MATDDRTLEATQRPLTTGVPGLDDALGGGLMSAALYLVEGRAGAGKTILASQLAFHRAAAGDKVIYVTLVAESHGKLLNHLRRLTFFDEGVIGHSVVLLSGYRALQSEGLDSLLRFLVNVTQEHRPAFMVLDGFRAAVSACKGEAALASFLHQLDVLATGTGCTTLLLSPISGNDVRPEHTLVDGIIEVSVAASGLRRTRLIEVRKLRGANHLTGQHVFTITEAGIHVFPRLEGLTSARWPEPREIPGRVGFGIPSLDALMDGGVMPASTTAILGAPGAGKTLLGLAFLCDGVRKGQQVEYFGFYESPERLVAKAAGVGLNLDEAVRMGQLVMHWQPPVELLADELTQRLLQSLERTGASRLFVDGLDVFGSTAAFPDRIQLLLTALTTRLRAQGITSIFSEELPLFGGPAPPDVARLSPTIENIILLRYVEAGGMLRRLISILKMRENAYDPSIRDFVIGAGGLSIGERFEGAPRLAADIGAPGQPFTAASRRPPFQDTADSPDS